jgi:hypothetical protein
MRTGSSAPPRLPERSVLRLPDPVPGRSDCGPVGGGRFPGLACSPTVWYDTVRSTHSGHFTSAVRIA